MQCTYHTDCCSNSCLTYSYKCVERHDKPNEDQPISVQNIGELLERFSVDRTTERHDKTKEDQPITVQNIEELIERFGGDSTTYTHHTDTTIVTSTMDSVETDQTTLTTNDVNQTQPICRAKGASVTVYSFKILLISLLKINDYMCLLNGFFLQFSAQIQVNVARIFAQE